MIRIIAVMAVLAALVFWYRGHRPIAYHNKCLRSAIGHCIRVELTLAPSFDANGVFTEHDPAKILTDREEMDQLLNHFILPLHERGSDKYHECLGHLKINVVMPNTTEYRIHYDHGDRIYPISQDSNPGYSTLPDATRGKLNSYLQSLGFSPAELGLKEVDP